MKNTEFNYKITEHIAVLSRSEHGDITKELNMVSFNGEAAKYDLRGWKRGNGKEMMLKGITLTGEEAGLLKDALEARSDL